MGLLPSPVEVQILQAYEQDSERGSSHGDIMKGTSVIVDLLHRGRKKRIVSEILAPSEPKGLVTLELTQKEFAEQRDDANKFRAYVSNLLCPLCANGKLELMAYEKGREGWEAAVTCNSCFVKGVFNSDGFRISRPLNMEAKTR